MGAARLRAGEQRLHLVARGRSRYCRAMSDTADAKAAAVPSADSKPTALVDSRTWYPMTVANAASPTGR